MTHTINIPTLGLIMEEATLIEWHYPEGAKVTQRTRLLTIETNKIGAEHGGFLQQVAEIDTELPVGALLGDLQDEEACEAAPSAGPAAPVGRDTTAASRPAPEDPPQETQRHEGSLADRDGARLLVSPIARRMAGDGRYDL